MLEKSEVHMTDAFRRLGIRSKFSVKMGVSVDSGLMDLIIESDDLSWDEFSELISAYRKKKHL